MNTNKPTENTALQAGYAAARLEIESLQARIKTMAEEHADELMVAHLDGRMRGCSTEPAGEYPALPKPGRRGPAGTGSYFDSFTADQMRAYADATCAMRVAQTAGAQQPTTQPAPDEIINMAREQGLPETEIEGVFRVNADDLCRVAAAILAARPPADSVTAPAATVIKKGAERQWMSERLGHLPDGTYNLYLSPPTQPAPQQEAQKAVAWARPVFATEAVEPFDKGDLVDVEFYNHPERPEGEGWRPLVFADTDDARAARKQGANHD